jgi:hypothetical protein
MRKRWVMSKAGDGRTSSSWFTVDGRPPWWLARGGVHSNGFAEFLRCSTRLRLGRKRWWSGTTTVGSEARVYDQI